MARVRPRLAGWQAFHRADRGHGACDLLAALVVLGLLLLVTELVDVATDAAARLFGF